MNLPISCSFHPYRPAAWLRASGPDAATFLQGQFTGDIRLATAREAVYGLWLDQKGKVLADSFILRGGGVDEFWVGSLFSPAATIVSRLEAYLIADEVAIEDVTADWTGFALVGGGAGAWLAAGPRAGVRFRGRRASEESWEWVLPAAEAAGAIEALAGARELSPADMETRRILAGLPAVPADIGPGDLPNEGGLEAEAISSTKGCYLGQEVMARLKSKGRIRRRLHRVAGPGTAPAVPSGLWQGGAKVGELRSAAPAGDGPGFVGWAMLTLAALRPELPLAPAPDGPGALRVVPPA